MFAWTSVAALASLWLAGRIDSYISRWRTPPLPLPPATQTNPREMATAIMFTARSRARAGGLAEWARCEGEEWKWKTARRTESRAGSSSSSRRKWKWRRGAWLTVVWPGACWGCSPRRLLLSTEGLPHRLGRDCVTPLPWRMLSHLGGDE